MRLIGALFALALIMASPARAETAACADNAIPLETRGSDQEQLDNLPKQGLVCAQEGKRATAIALFSEVIRRDPTNPVAYLNRGSRKPASARWRWRSPTSARRSA
jgi:Flp pilus assembly protein TadD